MQKNVETVLVVVLLELRVGDEFGHEEVCGRREKGGRDGGHWVGTTGVIGKQMGARLYEQTGFPRGKQDYATEGAGTDTIQG